MTSDDEARNHEEPGVEVEPLGSDEVALIPVDSEKGLVLALGYDLRDEGEPVARGLLDAALDKAGFLGGAYASKSLLDGSLVRLAPETVSRMREGAVFLKDKQGFALGSLREISSGKITDAVRFLPGAANPVAAGLMIQTMAIQRQLGQIQEALEQIDAKLDTLLKGQHHGVLGQLLSLQDPLDELGRKLRDGFELTDADEVSLRSYEDVARRRQKEAALWLSRLRELLETEGHSLRAQHDILDPLMKNEHVGFWLRIYIVSNLTLARARWMRLSRAAAVEDPAWVRQLQGDVVAQLDAMGLEIVSLGSRLDQYLRNHDIASGWEELSLRRKRRVRQLRRQLRDVHEQLRLGMAASEASIQAMLANAESFEIPKRLSRRDIEPWLIRDPVFDRASQGFEKAKELGTASKDATIRSADRLKARVEQEIAERRDGSARMQDEDEE